MDTERKPYNALGQVASHGATKYANCEFALSGPGLPSDPRRRVRPEGWTTVGQKFVFVHLIRLIKTGQRQLGPESPAIRHRILKLTYSLSNALNRLINLGSFRS